MNLIDVIFASVFVVLAILTLRQSELRLRGFTAILFCCLVVVALSRDRISELVVSNRELRVTLNSIENQLSEIAKAMETLVVSQQINKLQPDNSILLDYEPVPHSVRIIAGPLINYPRPSYGYQLKGRRIHIIHPDTLERIKGRLPSGVTVEYIRRIRLDKNQ